MLFTPAQFSLRTLLLSALGTLSFGILPAAPPQELTLVKQVYDKRVAEAKEVKACHEGLAEDQVTQETSVVPKPGAPTVATAKGPKGDDRKAAEMLLRNNCTIRVKISEEVTLKIKAGEALPEEDFELLQFEQSAPSQPPLTADDVSVLAHLRSLTGVTIRSAPVGNQVMEALKGSSELASLYVVADPSLTDEAFASLKHWPKLYHFGLRWCSGITGEGIRIIAETRPEIRELEINGTAIDDTAVPHLLKLKGLEDLWIDETKITQAGLEKLAGLPNLTSLALSGGFMAAPMDFTTFKKLKKLKITKSVSEALFQSLGKFPSTLEELWVEAVELTEPNLAILASGKDLKKTTLHQLKLPPSQLTSFAATATVQEVMIYKDDTSISDEGLMQLSGIKTLKKVSLGKGTTEAGIDAFKKAREDVQVVR